MDTQINFELWKEKVITPFLQSDIGKEIIKKVREDREKHKVFPEPSEIFDAFFFCPIDNIKIVLVGLDPYNTGNHAHGLSFSSKQLSTPPSLRIIFKELRRDLYSYMSDEQWKQFFPNNDLTNWAKRGILLLNRYLTVREGEAKSHKDFGWDDFQQNYVFKFLNEYDKPLVFILWGNDAQELKPWITNPKHLILTGYHPAADTYNPAQPKFAGCGHFSEATKFIVANRTDSEEKIINIEKYFKKELFYDLKKDILSECSPYTFKTDEELVNSLKSALKIAYNYGFDFILTK